MTFPTGVVEKTDEEMKAMLAESREAFRHSRKLGRVMEIVADHHLQQLKLQSKRAAGCLKEGSRLRSKCS